MKVTNRPGKPGTAKTEAESNPLSVLARIQLACLDDYTCERRGYDPYDSSKGRDLDVWSSKRKRA